MKAAPLSPNAGKWQRVGIGGVTWALAYNLVWAIAWFGFMRTEWVRASDAVGQPVPWTPAVWIFWGIVSLCLGALIMAYANGKSRRLWAACLGSLTTWFLFALGGLALEGGHPPRALVLDSAVDLTAMVAGSLAAVSFVRGK